MQITKPVDHSKDNIIEAFGVDKERSKYSLHHILHYINRQSDMGKPSELLEEIIKICGSTEEAVIMAFKLGTVYEKATDMMAHSFMEDFFEKLIKSMKDGK